MPILRVGRFTSLPVFSLLISGSWMFLGEYSWVQAQIPNNIPILAQGTLPYPQDISIDQQPSSQLPSVKLYQSQGIQYSQYNQGFDRYFVYVDSNNSQVLQRVRQIETNAYIRNYNGRKVIQSGVFNGQSNAKQRVRELELNGIPGAKIVDSDNIELSNTQNYQQENRNSYYVVIPSNSNRLISLGTEIRQRVSININVFRRSQPLGSHIAVGPFSDRLEAEQWNNYLKNSGYGNARVYYGK
ncbi:hypothetical protein [Dolichospermum sp. LEGE 00246]|uniref:hypothetical protein n=1 Tax=Dolichospermum sp. LEGE 00246 TaxID=1828605 RepID=UPI00187E4D4F|nr:hypothetical protein [Dolichospermum sp. LEGE 00246]MBE9259510.1 hypothetical protein [Dolichospermum sp. LEGE 00246]